MKLVLLSPCAYDFRMASTAKATDKTPAGTDAPKDLVQSVARALNIVDVIAAAKEPMRHNR